MSGDVVKSKSNFVSFGKAGLRLVFIVFIFMNLPAMIKDISLYFSLSSTRPIFIEEVIWKKPHVELTFSHLLNQEKILQNQKVLHLKVLSSSHFNEIKKDLSKSLTHGFFDPHHPRNLTLHKTFPYKKGIQLFLAVVGCILSSNLFVINFFSNKE